MDLTHSLSQPAAQRARALITGGEAEVLAEQLRIVVIPAPSGQEGQRARYLGDRFCALGLLETHTDEVGNVLSLLPGAESPDLPPLVVAAHLDTVFDAATDLSPRHVGGRVYAPGITDNARGVAALLALAQALIRSEIRTERAVWFVGTVGEEGNGDLRGSKHLFRSGGPISRPSGFVALDGSGIRRIVHRAIGARRLRVEITGPGGHSWSDWGTANPLHALGRAIERLVHLPLSSRPSATLTVARAGGGTSVNAIPGAAWFELDLRSERSEVIGELEAACRRELRNAIDEENRSRRQGTDRLTLSISVIGDRPSGQVPDTAPLVEASVAATRLVGARPELVASSTDANVPLSLGIPAVTLGAGGESGGIHTTEEWFSSREGERGLERGLLTLLAAAGVA